MCVEVPHLHYVVAAADHSSFRRAATALNITQPTLSKRIRELEDKLGILGRNGSKDSADRRQGLRSFAAYFFFKLKFAARGVSLHSRLIAHANIFRSDHRMVGCNL